MSEPIHLEASKFEPIAEAIREGLIQAVHERTHPLGVEDDQQLALISRYVGSLTDAIANYAGVLQLTSTLYGRLHDRDERIDRLVRRVEFLEKANKMLEEQGAITSDRLTGLFHNSHFLDLFDRAFSEAHRYANPLGFLMIDLDGFSEINASYGYAVGNKVIENVAQALKGCCRESDLICRYGGEEFAVALTQTDLKGAEFAAERIRRAIAELSIADEVGNPICQVTVSIGFDAVQSEDSTSFAVIDRAHRALRLSKKRGHNFTGGLEADPA